MGHQSWINNRHMNEEEHQESNMEKFKLPKQYADNIHNIWVEYIQIENDYKPLDLGMGYPDFAGSEYAMDALKSVTVSKDTNLQQYTDSYGHPRLVSALAKLYSPLVGQNIDPRNNIVVGNGAQEALFSSIMGHVDSGDEVIIIEPFFDCYVSMVQIAGGIPKFIALKPCPSSVSASSGDWLLNPEELESLFNQRTKIIIINTPNNPLGKVFTREELEMIASFCKKWNVLCISDEVYEWMVYKPNKHIRIASLPGMWERTITIGSAGKSFGVTGWRVGWAYGPADLIHNVQVAHENCIYTCATPIQEAIAMCIEKELTRLDNNNCYFIKLTNEMQLKRDYMVKFLNNIGMSPIIPEGGYFMIADWSPLKPVVDLETEHDEYKDFRFTKWMTKHVGIQGIPPTAFYSAPHKYIAEHFVRYCFIKKDENLKKAADILNTWKNQIKQ